MMILEHLILSRDSSIDQEKNTLSVFDMIEELNIKTNAPSITVPLQVLAVLRREKETGKVDDEIDLTILSPKNEKLFELPVPFKMAAEHKRMRLRINVNFPIASSGEYKIKINGLGVSSELPLTIKFEK